MSSPLSDKSRISHGQSTILGIKLKNNHIRYKVVNQKHLHGSWTKGSHIDSITPIINYWKKYIKEQTEKVTENIPFFEPQFENVLPMAPEEEPIEILGIVRNCIPYRIAIKIPSSKSILIVPSQYLHHKYPKQLSEYYEKHILFDSGEKIYS